jgi:hypothetical protein
LWFRHANFFGSWGCCYFRDNNESTMFHLQW